MGGGRNRGFTKTISQNSFPSRILCAYVSFKETSMPVKQSAFYDIGIMPCVILQVNKTSKLSVSPRRCKSCAGYNCQSIVTSSDALFAIKWAIAALNEMTQKLFQDALKNLD